MKTIPLLQSIAKEAGKMMLDINVDTLHISCKTSGKDIVTQYDKSIQQFIISSVSQRINDAKFIAEELGVTDDINAEHLFIIDPIDGTSNFVHNMGYSAVSIAYYSRSVPVAGVVYNPFSDEMYYGVTGEGSFLNHKCITVNDNKLEESLVFFGTSPYNSETTATTFDLVRKIYDKCMDIRRYGSAALDICKVAEGSGGLYFEAALSVWDYAAAQIIMKEAGGTLVDFKGKPISISLKKTSVIAGNINIINQSGLIGVG